MRRFGQVLAPDGGVAPLVVLEEHDDVLAVERAVGAHVHAQAGRQLGYVDRRRAHRQRELHADPEGLPLEHERASDLHREARTRARDLGRADRRGRVLDPVPHTVHGISSAPRGRCTVREGTMCGPGEHRRGELLRVADEDHAPRTVLHRDESRELRRLARLWGGDGVGKAEL